MSKPLLEIPQEIYTSDKACGEFIFETAKKRFFQKTLDNSFS